MLILMKTCKLDCFWDILHLTEQVTIIVSGHFQAVM